MKALIPLVLVIVGVAAVVGLAARDRLAMDPRLEQSAAPPSDLMSAVASVDADLAARWEEAGIEPAPLADDLTILRRLSLALHGTIPSLEELRRFEADQRPERLPAWTAAMLEDDRFNDYFAERLARAFVGVEGGQFIIYRRDRFTEWLSEQLQEHRPYDELVRTLLTSTGVWTGEPEANFVTAVFANDELDEEKLTGRTVRAFLGQRIDCAQCHDHPFAQWKQSQFEGLAAHFGQVRVSAVGVEDESEQEYEVEDRETLERKTIAPSVPFHPEWLPATGTRREQLAAWVTHPENRRFERAIANRVWGLMFGKPYVLDVPVDDLPDPGDESTAPATRVLDLLGEDFRRHGCDLRRMIQVIAASRAFRCDSRHPLDSAPAEGASPEGDSPESAHRALADRIEVVESRWGVFPLIRLRPEQVIGAMLQARNVQTVDVNSHLFTRAQRFLRERDFVNEFGDPGENELQDRVGTIPQALLRMNGDFAADLSDATPFSAPGRIAGYSSTPERLLENSFLVTLTRRPTPEEAAVFVPQLQGPNPPDGAVQDLFWTLFNSPEFSWNH